MEEQREPELRIVIELKIIIFFSESDRDPDPVRSGFCLDQSTVCKFL